MLLILSLTSLDCLIPLASIAASKADNNTIDYQFKVTDGGYWCDDATGRKILEALRTYRLQNETLKSDYNSLVASYTSYIAETKQNINTLERLFEAERQEWKAEVAKAKSPGIGIFAGPGYAVNNKEIDFVIGIGFVWRIW